MFLSEGQRTLIPRDPRDPRNFYNNPWDQHDSETLKEKIIYKTSCPLLPRVTICNHFDVTSFNGSLQNNNIEMTSPHGVCGDFTQPCDYLSKHYLFIYLFIYLFTYEYKLE